MAQHNVYRFRAELNNYKPKIWRVFEIAGSKTIAELCYTLMILFDMRAAHLFSLLVDMKSPAMQNLRDKYDDDYIQKMWNKLQCRLFMGTRSE